MADERAIVKLGKMCAKCRQSVYLDCVKFLIILEVFIIKQIPRDKWIKPSWLVRRLKSKADKYKSLTSHCHRCGGQI